MRAEFLNGLSDLADRDPRVVLLTADLGFGSIEVFRDRHPERFFNVGVAEQAMVGTATGLAEGGFVPYCYSIAAFSVARTFEFLRNGPIAHELPVRLIGVGPGFDYSVDGITHYALEDLSLLAFQPNVEIVAPADAISANAFAREGSSHPGLVYYRLARNTEPLVTDSSSSPEEAAACWVLGLGDACSTAQGIASAVNRSGLIARTIVVERISDASIHQLVRRIQNSEIRQIITCENHYVRGGLGTVLADALMAVGWNGRLHKWGVEMLPIQELGGPEFMRNMYCTSKESLIREVLTFSEIGKN